MEKIYGGNERQDALIKVGKSYYLYYGFGRDSEEAEHGYNYRHKFDHKPTPDEIKEQVLAAIDMHASERITRGLTYNGYKVNLTIENQTNYTMFKSMGRYPVLIKVEDAEGNDVVLSLTKEEFSSFITSMQNHIKECLQESWNEKANLDLSVYAQ